MTSLVIEGNSSKIDVVFDQYKKKKKKKKSIKNAGRSRTGVDLWFLNQ